MSLAYKAMQFAMQAHANHQRKYTGAPYATHLAEVAGIVSTLGQHYKYDQQVMAATAWLHDCVEDCNVFPRDLKQALGDDSKAQRVINGVMLLSDLEQGTRAERKAASRDRLELAPGWVQTIKCADLISNTSSIRQYDPKFATLYLEEKRALLQVLTKAHPKLRAMAWDFANRP